MLGVLRGLDLTSVVVAGVLCGLFLPWTTRAQDGADAAGTEDAADDAAGTGEGAAAPADAGGADIELPAGAGSAADVPGSTGPAVVTTVPAGPIRTFVVVDAAAYGIDPIVGRVTTDVMRRVGAAMGYQVLDGPTTVAAAQRVHMPYPPTPADLWRVTWASSSHRGAFARVWADSGQYVIELTVASMDGTGPFHARGTAGSDDLRQVVERLLRSILHPPEMWAATASAPPPGLTPAAPVRRRTAREELGHPTGRDGRRWRRPEPEIRRFSLVLTTEASVGATEGSFYNHYVGLRLDLRITRDFIIGVSGAYGNLEGRDQRVSSVWVMAHGEYRIRPSGTLDLTIPIRVGAGYLGWNGAVLRASAGLNYGISESWEIGVDLLAPTFYILPSGLAVAFDFSLELGYRF